MSTEMGLELKKKGIQAINLLCSLNLCLSAAKVFRLPNIRDIRFNRRFMPLKYLGSYLARSFDYRCRADILMHHYQFLNEHLTKESIAKIAEDKVILWDNETQGETFSISLDTPYKDLEGDLSLNFHYGSTSIYCISFTITKGWHLGMSEDQVIFITRIQGEPGKFNLIKKATKELNEVTPAMMLLTTVQAIAATLDIKGIAGITAKEQIATTWEPVDNFLNSYDNFWDRIGGKKINSIAFELPIDPKGKPINMIKISHRCRTKNKREFKQAVFEHVCSTFRQKCVKPESWQALSQRLHSEEASPCPVNS